MVCMVAVYSFGIPIVIHCLVHDMCSNSRIEVTKDQPTAHVPSLLGRISLELCLTLFLQFMTTTMSVTAGTPVSIPCRGLHLSLVCSHGVRLRRWLLYRCRLSTGISTVALCLTDNIILMVSVCSALQSLLSASTVLYFHS